MSKVNALRAAIVFGVFLVLVSVAPALSSAPVALKSGNDRLPDLILDLAPAHRLTVSQIAGDIVYTIRISPFDCVPSEATLTIRLCKSPKLQAPSDARVGRREYPLGSARAIWTVWTNEEDDYPKIEYETVVEKVSTLWSDLKIHITISASSDEGLRELLRATSTLRLAN